MIQNSILQLRDVTKQFAQGNDVVGVLKGITLSFEQGKSYAITGSSGSGKSTLLHIIAGIEEPTSGSVLYNTQQIQLFTAHERSSFLNNSIGLLFQNSYLIKELTVIENVMIKGLIARTKETHEQALHLLERVGLIDKQHELPPTLSGGQQQRIALARALFNKPSFLLADEPTAHLDLTNGRAMIELIKECQREWRMGLIVCSHDHYVTHAMETVLNLDNGIVQHVK